MKSEQSTSFPKSRRKRILAVLGAFIAIATLTCLWFAGALDYNSDPLFRGRPESEWIKNLEYNDDEQVKEWRGYGEAGVQVLIRGLERVNRPGEKKYRQLYRKMPGFVSRWLPAPKPDSTSSTRMRLVSLLSSLGNDAKSAVPMIIVILNRDEADGVRQIAINFFTTSEDESCLLNQLPPEQKQKLLPGLIRALRDPGNWGLRNNAANALQWFPERRDVVAPALVAALQDSEAQVRLLAALALNRVAPDVAKESGAITMIIAIAKNPDDQLASRAVRALRFFEADTELAVPALIESLDSTNTLIACEAVWALEWAPKEFKKHADTVVPALRKAAARKDNVGRYAAVALKRFQYEGDPTQAIK